MERVAAEELCSCTLAEEKGMHELGERTLRTIRNGCHFLYCLKHLETRSNLM